MIALGSCEIGEEAAACLGTTRPGLTSDQCCATALFTSAASSGTVNAAEYTLFLKPLAIFRVGNNGKEGYLFCQWVLCQYRSNRLGDGGDGAITQVEEKRAVGSS